MSVLRVKNGDQWDIVPAIKGDTGDPAADESITDAMLVPDGIKTEIDWLWGNQLMDSREGELLQTDDAYEAPLVSLDVDGKSTQVTTTGKNLFDKNNHGYWDGSVGTEGHHAGPTSPDYSYFRIPVTEGDVVYASNPAGAHRLAWSNGLVAIDSGIAFPYTVPAGIDEVSGYFERSKFSYATVTLNNSDLTYEPYSGGKPSPSPDWPQPIESVDEPELTLAGKNLIQVVDTAGVVVDGNTITVSGTNRDLFTGSTGRSAKVGNLSKVPLLPAGTFAFSCNKTGSTNFYLESVALDGTVYDIMSSSASATHMAWKFTLDEPTRITVRATHTTLTDLQVEVGSIATEYVPFDSSISVLLSHEVSLRSLPDGTKDELHLSYLRPSTREGWAWYDRKLVQAINQAVVDETYNWRQDSGTELSDGTWRFECHIGNKGQPISNWSSPNNAVPAYCDYLQVASTSAVYYGAPDHFGMYQHRFYIRISGITTVDELKAWLSEHPLTVVYPIASIATQLDPIELPIMPSKDTTIWSDPSAQLKMTYIQDTNLVIESLEATVADMATS